MQPFPLKIEPGVVTDATRYVLKGRWVASDKIRFINGFPQSMGGWRQAFAQKLEGVCRSMKSFGNLTGARSVAFGTNSVVKVWHRLGIIYDITPTYTTHEPVDNPFFTTINDQTIILMITIPGLVVGDRILISGTAGAVGGRGGAIFNQTWVVSSIGAGYLTFEVPFSILDTSNGAGGTNVVVKTFYPVGPTDSVAEGGWGQGVWGAGVWGGDADPLGEGDIVQPRIWSLENWGEDLLISPNDGPIFYWKEDTPDARAVDISTMVGASHVPLMARRILTTDRSRILMAFATNAIGSTVQDPMLLRWSDNENYLEWDPTKPGSAAGELRLSMGSVFVAALGAPSEVLAWTDTTLYGIRETGNNEIFSAVVLSPAASIAGPKAAVVAGDAVYWFGVHGFFRYAGSVQHMPCPVEELLNSMIDRRRLNKAFAASNTIFNEVMWFIVTNDSPDQEPDAYVKFNHVDNVWDIGRMPRTAWIDSGVLERPLAVRVDGRVVYHDTGYDDASESVSVPIRSFIASGPVEIDEAGYHFVTTRAIISDVLFQTEGPPASPPSLLIEFEFDRFPGNDPSVEKKEYWRPQVDVAVTPGSSGAGSDLRVLVTPHTTQSRFRGRGRSVAISVEGGRTLGYGWRLGLQRLIGRADGRK